MILVLDNYDSFTYNLVQRMGEIDPTVEIKVVRNDKLTIDEVRQLAPARILISPAGGRISNPRGLLGASIDRRSSGGKSGQGAGVDAWQNRSNSP